MTRNHIAYSLVLLVSIITSACNNDIFTENQDLPEITNITIDGDGGEWSSVLSLKGLTHIYIDYGSKDIEYVRYYGANGSEVNPDCSPTELKSIVYENPKTYYSIDIVGEMIYILSYYNASPYTSFTLRLDYESGVNKFVYVTITEGKKLQMFLWEPTGDLVLEKIGEKTHRTSFTNNSSIAQRLEIKPFLESTCFDMLTPTDNWALNLTVDIPMLTFNGQEWEWRELKDIILGDRRNFTPSQYFFDDKITVEVPANTKAIVTYKLNYTQATQDGFITFYNIVAEQNFKTPVVWNSVYATSYEYDVEYE